jgi:hypothetical protein
MDKIINLIYALGVILIFWIGVCAFYLARKETSRRVVTLLILLFELLWAVFYGWLQL